MRPMTLGRKNWLFAESDKGTSCCPSAYVLIKQRFQIARVRFFGAAPPGLRWVECGSGQGFNQGGRTAAAAIERSKWSQFSNTT
jgi:hypothetical protein